MLALIIASIVCMCALAFWLGRGRALAVSLAAGRLRARPVYYGHYVALWCALPALAGVLAAAVVAPDARGALLGASLALGALGAWFGRGHITDGFNARVPVERAIRIALGASSLVAVITTLGIIASLIFEAARFFERVPLGDFLFGLQWSPQTAIRADQVGSSGAFGAVPVFAGTLLITAIAMCVAVPIGLLAAIYLADYAAPRTRAVVKPLLELLAGIPTVVYGFFAALTLAPAVRGLGERIGLEVSSESALVAGGVMGAHRRAHPKSHRL